MTTHPRLLVIPLAAALLLPCSDSSGRPTYTGFIPWGRLNACANCHLDPAGGGTRNNFGRAFENEAFTWTAALAAVDSDGDGFTNGEELQDPPGTWIVDDPFPGNPLLVSSAGRSSSRPGERLLVLSEIHQTADGRFFVEVSNTSTASQPLGQKWLVFADAIVAAGDVLPPMSGQMRLLAPGEAGELAGNAVQLFELDFSGVPPAAFTATDGFVMLVLFEGEELGLAEGVDPGLAHTIGDYVEWGPLAKPYNSIAMEAQILPQWDVAGGLPAGPAPGSSLEYDLAGQSIVDWYAAAEALTLGQPRPVASLRRPMRLGFPVGTAEFTGLGSGFETVNFDPAWTVPANWPYVYGVVLDAPAVPSSIPGEQVIRLTAQPHDFSTPALYRTTMTLPGQPGRAHLGTLSFDLRFSQPVPSPDPPTLEENRTFQVHLEFRNGSTSTGARIVFAKSVLVVRATRDGAVLREAIVQGAPNPVDDWVRVTLDLENDLAEMTVRFAIARRDGSEAVQAPDLVISRWLSNPAPDATVLTLHVPAERFEAWMNRLVTVAPDDLKTGYVAIR